MHKFSNKDTVIYVKNCVIFEDACPKEAARTRDNSSTIKKICFNNTVYTCTRLCKIVYIYSTNFYILTGKAG